MGCNCRADNALLESKITKLEELVEQLSQRVDRNQESSDEEFTSISDRVRDLENLSDNGYSVEDYG